MVDNDTGRVLSDQALVSDQAASRLAPSGFDPSRIEALEDVLRGLASYLGCGGYNAETVDPDVFGRKIRDGIDMLTAPLERDARRYRRLRSLGAAPGGSLHLENGTLLVTTNLDVWLDDCLRDGRAPAPSHAVTYSERYGFRDSDASLAEDPQGLSGEAVAARAGGIAP